MNGVAGVATKSSTFIISIAKLAQTFVDVVSSTDSSRPGQPGSYWSQVSPLFQPYYLPVWPYGYKYYSADPHVPPPPPPRTEASTSARQAEANPAGNPSRSRSHMTRRDLNLCQDCSILPCIMFWQSSRFQPQHRFRSIKLWRYSHCELLHNSFAHRLSPHGCVGGIMDFF